MQLCRLPDGTSLQQYQRWVSQQQHSDRYSRRGQNLDQAGHKCGRRITDWRFPQQWDQHPLVCPLVNSPTVAVRILLCCARRVQMRWYPRDTTSAYSTSSVFTTQKVLSAANLPTIAQFVTRNSQSRSQCVADCVAVDLYRCVCCTNRSLLAVDSQNSNARS